MATYPPQTFSLKRGTFLYGVSASVLMMSYFLLITVLGWQQWQGIQFGSFLFLVPAVALAIRAYRADTPRPAPYLSGLGLSFAVSLVGSVLYASGIFLYVNVAHQKGVLPHTYFGLSLSPFTLAATITLLGVIIGSLAGYILMMANGPDEEA